MRGKARNFFFDLKLFLLQLREFKIVNTGASLQNLDMVGEGLVFSLQFLQMRTQAHDLPPAG